MGKRGRPLGWKMPQRVKDQIAESKTGYIHDEETKKKIAGTVSNYWDGGAIGKGKYRYISVEGILIHEHRYKAEQVLGRPLREGEVVHHIDGDKSNNRHDNLMIMTSRDHFSLHHRIRKQKRNVKVNRKTKKRL